MESDLEVMWDEAMALAEMLGIPEDPPDTTEKE